jgi:hypothetical protein
MQDQDGDGDEDEKKRTRARYERMMGEVKRIRRYGHLIYNRSKGKEGKQGMKGRGEEKEKPRENHHGSQLTGQDHFN